MRFPINADSFETASDSDSWKNKPEGLVQIPVAPHCGSFLARRKNHLHEGVDLYCPIHTPIFAIEAGVVEWIGPFTGKQAKSPWWLDTQAVIVAGPNRKILYGEIVPDSRLALGMPVAEGQPIGRVAQVLSQDKGRPMCMLHMEVYAPDAPNDGPYPGNTLSPPPAWVLDPAPVLLSCRLPDLAQNAAARASAPKHN